MQEKFCQELITVVQDLNCQWRRWHDVVSNLIELDCQGDIGKSRSFWVTKDLLAWNPKRDSSQVYLHSSNTPKLKSTAKGVEGGDCLTTFLSVQQILSFFLFSF